MGRISRTTALQTEVTSPETAAQKPNIVFILVDNLGYGELRVYGGGILRGAPRHHASTNLRARGPAY
jgi:arylsulfatase A-like enzyme